MGKTGSKTPRCSRDGVKMIGNIVENTENGHWGISVEICGGPGRRNRQKNKQINKNREREMWLSERSERQQAGKSFCGTVCFTGGTQALIP